MKGPWFSGLDFLVTSDPLNIQHVLTTNFANYPKGPAFRELFELLGYGVLNVDSDLWRVQRKMFQLSNVRLSKFEVTARTTQGKVVHDLIPFLDHVSKAGIEVC